MHNQYTLIHSILKNGLNTSLVILEKGKAFAAEKGIPETDLLNAALAPDMLESFANADNVKVTFPWMPGKYFEMQNYVEGFVTQNFHFHVSIAYAILRNKGVNLGKQDYISGLIPKDLA